MSHNSKPIDIEDMREEYEDSLFRYLMAGYAQEVGAELQAENKALKAAGEFEPSQEAIRKFDRALNKAFRKRRIANIAKKAYTSVNKAVVFIVAVIAIFTVTALAVDNIRIGVLNFLIGFEDEYTSLRLDPAKGNNIIGENLYVSWAGGYIPAYVPEGYRIVNVTNTYNTKSIFYENAEDKFVDYSEYSADTTTRLDTEGAETEIVKVNEYDALLVEKDGDLSVAWSDGQRMFVIISQLDKQELIKMAINVNIVK